MSQIVLPLCAHCFHGKVNHESSICNGSLECMCQKYIEPVLFEFAQLVEKEKLKRKTIQKRCEYLLEQIPQTRNAGEKSFYRIFLEVWYGVKIRVNNPQVLDKKTWDRIPNAETVGRAKRLVKHNNEELRTYDPKVLLHQTAIFTALMELSTES